ncbi:acyltransferase-like protein [Beauveria bassiana ARSEF 2860]|uniref:Acyltransferase-like protein n=1 Tax=Beauveria bassiana (strain ARSEF 2860) TaxID=655819 RepID=J5JIW8_BEAB2|nr:acyltransferase-like protein [Beauveria bassiana ARSEF 2860]EJP65493.1 acyltransferase-like protein [Beauveria bassiana ARSEF 2860]
MSRSSHHSPHREEKLELLAKHVSDVESDSDIFEEKPRFSLTLSCQILTAPWIYARSTSWRPLLLLRLGVFLIPSFLQGRHAREQIRPAHLSPTAYLDGMRGLAALVVFFCHYFYQAFIIAEGWGAGETNYHLLKLPFIRLFYQGPPAVCLFFVISGYALSYRPLKLVRSRAPADLATAISSLVFRRGIRLYLPTAISTLLIVCLLRVGAYEWTREFATDRTYMKNVVETHPPRMEFASDQLLDWAKHMYRFVHVFDWNQFGGSTYYDVHLWTIPVEFRCSLYLFLVLIGTARLQAKFRFIVVGGIMWFVYSHSRWELLLFLCGMVLAEMDLIRGAHKTSSPDLLLCKLAPVRRPRWKRLCWAGLALVGLYLMCQPDLKGNITPGWVWLHSQIPIWWRADPYRYYQSLGAVVFAYAVGHSPSWQAFFNTAPVQYFGKISYALYLMHGPALHCIGYHWERMAYAITGVDGYWYNVGFVLGAVFCIPTVVWCADIFWRAVDIPTVKFAKWVESKCIVQA